MENSQNQQNIFCGLAKIDYMYYVWMVFQLKRQISGVIFPASHVRLPDGCCDPHDFLLQKRCVGACCSPEKFRQILHNPHCFTNSPWNSGAAAASVVVSPVFPISFFDPCGMVLFDQIQQGLSWDYHDDLTGLTTINAGLHQQKR